jgi:hypothetical protein
MEPSLAEIAKSNFKTTLFDINLDATAFSSFTAGSKSFAPSINTILVD